MSGIEVIPSARRLIKSLRDLGYDFSQAVADIVDNSIAAGASAIAIDIEFDGDDSWLRISDNGRGMKPDELREAMRYGSERDYEDEDLGKFGLGLKTASMSQCQRLSVASRWNTERSDIAAYSWDLDHIARTNRWEILPVDRNGLEPTIRQPLRDSTGTVVLWQRLDRILGYKHPYGEAARKRLSQLCREIEQHLGMVFHRFLLGQVRGKKFELRLNGIQIKPWDPFCRSETKTKGLEAFSIHVEHEGKAGDVVFEPFVLPHQDDFSSMEAFRLASGPSGWNQQQGFYIFRANRMIQSGGWSNLHAPDEHMKLARVAVSFNPKLDEAFKINVAKMRVQMPSQIREDVRTAIAPVRKLAREAYDRKAARPSSAAPSPATSTSPPPAAMAGSTPGGPAPGTPTSGGPGRPQPASATAGEQLELRLSVSDWESRLMAEACDSEKPVIRAVMTRIRAKLAK